MQNGLRKLYISDLWAAEQVFMLYLQEISAKIAGMITPEGCPSEIRVVYQTIENLHRACPAHQGDWYFSGNYPTPGGNRLVNKAFVDWYEKR